MTEGDIYVTSYSPDALFADGVVTPTELARHVRRITQMALRRPVTVHRADGDLALLSRDRVGELIATSAAVDDVLDFSRNFLWLLRGKGRPSPSWGWLESFSPDDIADFLEEYLAAVQSAAGGQTDWDAPAAVLHEWQEGARALTNQALLAEWAGFRGVATDEETSRLTAKELQARLTAVASHAASVDAS
jgi:hypothetical protein